jgi:hypothetical protein
MPSEYVLAIIPVLSGVRGANPTVKVTLEQHNLKGKVMRSTFNIKLQIDIGQMDETRRNAYIDLVKLTAKQYYAQAAMIASSTPQVSITSTDRRNGEVNIPLFDTEESEDD